MDIIQLKNVRKSYRNGFFSKEKKTALHDLSFSVESGEVVGIVGPNGAGKSTAIKILMGLIRPDSGEVNIMGYHANSIDARRQVGYLPETPSLYLHLTLLDHLRFCAKLEGYGRQKTKERIDEVISIVKLDKVAKTRIGKFSKGMRQRAALAYAIFSEPQILILDEPMSGLDPIGRHLVIELMRKLNENGVTILFCSHILNDVERICTRIGIMHQGKLRLVTTPAEIRNNYEGRSEHLGPLEVCFMNIIDSSDATS